MRFGNASNIGSGCKETLEYSHRARRFFSLSEILPPDIKWNKRISHIVYVTAWERESGYLLPPTP